MYDLRNRLVSVTADNVTTAYKYDPAGNRVGRTSGSTTVSYLVDPMNLTGYSQVLEAWSGGSTPAMTYTIGGDVIAQAAGSTVRFLIYDGHGSVRNHAGSNGELKWFDIQDKVYKPGQPENDTKLLTYDAWGQECNGLSGDGLYYSGEMYDTKLSMYNFRARWYSPATGRFNRMDDYSGNESDPPSLHRYLYAHCDPINFIDPSGEFTVLEINMANLYRSVMSSIDLSVFESVEISAQTHLSGGTMEQALTYMAISNIAPYLIGPTIDLISSGIDNLFSVIRRLKPSRMTVQGSRLVGAVSELATMHRRMGRGKDATEIIGIIGGGLTTRQLGYLPTGFKPMYHGIDDIWRMGDEFLIIEYKGGTGSLIKTTIGEQMSQRWIIDRLRMAANDNPQLIAQVRKALTNGKVKGMVVTTPVLGKNAFIPNFDIQDFSQIKLTRWK